MSKTNEEGKTKVRVIVAPRDGGHTQVWASAKRWPVGETAAELTDDEIANLAARVSQGVIVLDGSGRRIVSNEGLRHQALSEYLTSDEQSALAEYRQKKLANPELAERYGGKTRTTKGGDEKPWKTAEKVDVNEVINSSAGAGVGPAGMRPTDNADILQGKTPESPGSAGVTTPFETHTTVGQGGKKR